MKKTLRNVASVVAFVSACGPVKEIFSSDDHVQAPSSPSTGLSANASAAAQSSTTTVIQIQQTIIEPQKTDSSTATATATATQSAVSVSTGTTTSKVTSLPTPPPSYSELWAGLKGKAIFTNDIYGSACIIVNDEKGGCTVVGDNKYTREKRNGTCEFSGTSYISLSCKTSDGTSCTGQSILSLGSLHPAKPLSASDVEYKDVSGKYSWKQVEPEFCDQFISLSRENVAKQVHDKWNGKRIHITGGYAKNDVCVEYANTADECRVVLTEKDGKKSEGKGTCSLAYEYSLEVNCKLKNGQPCVADLYSTRLAYLYMDADFLGSETQLVDSTYQLDVESGTCN